MKYNQPNRAYTARGVVVVASLRSDTERWATRDAFITMSLNRADLVPSFDEMRANGEPARIVKRSVRVLGTSFPVYVLINREVTS